MNITENDNSLVAIYPDIITPPNQVKMLQISGNLGAFTSSVEGEPLNISGIEEGSINRKKPIIRRIKNEYTKTYS